MTGRHALRHCDVVVLAGGLGTRLRGTIGDRPKVLAPVADRTFLDYLLDQLTAAGAQRIVFLLGFRADAVQTHLAEHPRPGLETVCLVETQPLGTGGALRAAIPALRSDPVLVMNGDSFLEVDYGAFLRAFRRSGATAALASVGVPDVGRYGALALDRRHHIHRFIEKQAAGGPGAINGGLYLLSQEFLAHMAQGVGTSFERDVLERQPAGTLFAYRVHGRFLDIGTPESLAQAPAIMTIGDRG